MNPELVAIARRGSDDETIATRLLTEDDGFQPVDRQFHYARLDDWAYRVPVQDTRLRAISEIEDLATSEIEETLLSGYIARQVAMQSLLRQASRFNSRASDEVQLRRGSEFMRHTVELFGAPRPELFWQIYGQKIDWLQSLDLAQLPYAEASRARLLGADGQPALLPERAEGTTIELPAQTTIDRLNDWVERNFANVLGLAGEDPLQQFGPLAMQDLYNRAFTVRGLDRFGWHSILVDNPRGPFSTSVNRRSIDVPQDKSPLSFKVARKKLLHEFMHAWRSHRGAQSGVGLAEFGLPGHIFFEETFCKVLETALDKKIDPAMITGHTDYLAIGLTMGVDGQQRTAPDIFEIFYNLNIVRKALTNENQAEVLEFAHDNAVDRVKSIFRGTPGNLPGVCYTHNLVYFENYGNIWQTVEEAEDLDALMNYYLSGKSNPFDAQHRAVMGEIPLAA